MTPIRLDPRSAVSVAAVLARLLLNPRAAPAVAEKAVAGYSLTAEAVRTIIDLGATRQGMGEKEEPAGALARGKRQLLSFG